MQSAVRPTVGKAFYTELPGSEREGIVEHHKRLSSYIDNFDNRMKYAKWKQELVLMYNYEPLASIVKKTEEVKRQYLKKIQEENLSNELLYNTDKIMTDLSTFKAFSEKLQAKLVELQVSIDEWEMKKQVLNSELNDKRVTLKRILDENYKMNTELLKKQGIRNKGDIMVALRKKAFSLKAFPTARSHQPTNPATDRKPTNPSSVSTKKEQCLPLVPLGLNRLLFEECFDLLIKNIRSMNSSQDIQQGIFLDLVAKQKSKSVMGLNPKPSGKGSMIYDILLNSYNQRKKKQFAFDFAIEWQTFRRFNWRQMLGVMLMHEGSDLMFKAIAKKWN